MPAGKFTWDGEEFDMIRDHDEWTLREAIAVEDYFAQPVETLRRTQQYAAVLWVSIRRRRRDFTLDQVLELEQGAPTMHVLEQPAAEAPADDAAGGEVLSPTNAGDAA